ncbi:MAG: nucleotidyl transferase AbiEii/AbiGii toxin family protein [Chitinispirillaceae bacterium]|nr:nucleotidyl transferase AbiEii/AbiGii toxin family protein [Chitinispirillaceae bacterium]
MLDMVQIQSFYPQRLRHFKRNILQEYLQFKVLEAVFSSRPGLQLTFLGGTAIHIVHGNPRFSEDLDFDSGGLPFEAFEEMAIAVHRTLRREGYDVEIDLNRKGNFRANLRFIGLLQQTGISSHREEKLLIHLDAEPQNFDYLHERIILNRFDVFCRINVVPVGMLLSQKIACILQRPRAIGRDFHDAIFLWGKTGPDFRYLAHKAGIGNECEMWKKLEARCATLDFNRLATDLEPFVTDASEAEKIKSFREFVAMNRLSRQ